MGSALGRDLGGLDLGRHAAARKLRSGRAGHRFDRGGDALHHRNELGPRILGGRRLVEAVDVGQEHQQVGARHRGDTGGQPVVVAVADLVGGDRVVLVDHRHRAPFQELVDGGARVEIAPPLLGVLQGHQHLPGGDAVAAEHLRPGAGERDLPDRRRGLAVLELERPRRQPEHGTAERDRPGRDHQQVALVARQRGDVLRKRCQPIMMEPSALAVDQERGADLHHNAAEVTERWKLA